MSVLLHIDAWRAMDDLRRTCGPTAHVEERGGPEAAHATAEGGPSASPEPSRDGRRSVHVDTKVRMPMLWTTDMSNGRADNMMRGYSRCEGGGCGAERGARSTRSEGRLPHVPTEGRGGWGGSRGGRRLESIGDMQQERW